MRAQLSMVEAAGRRCPAVRLTCSGCSEDCTVYLYDGDVPSPLRPVLPVLVERFEPETLPGVYLCSKCEADGGAIAP